ncbi:(2Fe-2S)-binding protein [Kitasatospora azatica]|uniref:(2Fe-2S)-binding protein n=1 Tax=Kitasatospora azatica TaxID=58347 RepID=UPI0007C7D71C|nr:(2Fe-2S)-binding protein [Kitasatospora azatica]
MTSGMTSDPLHAVAALGPYFAVEVGAARDAAPPPGYRPLRELYATGPDSPLAARVRQVADRLHTREPRVAASVMQLGLAARFWSVALGTLALTGRLPDLDQDRAHWRQLPEGPLDLWLPAPGTTPDEDLHHALVRTTLTPLNAAVRSATPVSERLLWGNAASALVGTLRMMHRQLAAANPPAYRTAEDATRSLLARAPLLGTLAAHGPTLRRTSCCLYYRIPGGGLCGDCVFDTPPTLAR